MQNRLTIIVAAIAVIAAAALFISQSSGPGETVIGTALAQEVEGAETDGVDTSGIIEMVLGDPEAPIEIIEYASFTCPHCASFHGNQFKELKANYIDTGSVRFVYREVYFDRPGLWASMLARCGGEVRFFGITEMLYDQQREWTAGGDPALIIGNLRTIGKVAGMTDDDLDACFSDADKAQALVAWYEANRAEHDINSTPSFVIDGEKYSNMPYAEFASLLDGKLGG